MRRSFRSFLRAALTLLALLTAAPGRTPAVAPAPIQQECADVTAPFHAAADVIGQIPLADGRTTSAPIGSYRTWSCVSIADLQQRAEQLEQRVRAQATAQAAPRSEVP
jgi:hypothetical protein